MRMGMRVMGAVVALGVWTQVAAQGCPEQILPVDVSSPDRVVGDGSPGSCTESAVRAAITQGGTIRCDCGEPAPVVTLSEELVVDKPVVFDGGGMVLDGGGGTRHFRKTNVSANQSGGLAFTLQNVTLRNGLGDSLGGAVLNETFGAFTAINVVFENNHCAERETPDWGGGAVYSFLQRDVVLAHCRFVNNSGANGGAVAGIGNSLTIYECEFDSNQATGSGGGADAGPGGQGGIGGAVYIDNVDANGVNNYLTICRSTFRGNLSNAHGGALFAYFRPGHNSVGLVNQCTFAGNREQTDKAGALYQQNGTFTLSNSTCTDNTAEGQGGAFWGYRDVSDTGSIQIVNCTFEGNRSESGLGGAITLSNNTRTRISSTTIANNRAGVFAAGIFMGGVQMVLTNTLFSNNEVLSGDNANPYGGVTVNKGMAESIVDGGGNMQWPITYNGQWGPFTDFWLDEFTGVARVDAGVQPLADNGGPTPTMALVEGSPAVDAGVSGCMPTDQRGVARRDGCDIGAFELDNSAVAAFLRPRGVSGGMVRWRGRLSFEGMGVAPGTMSLDLSGRRLSRCGASAARLWLTAGEVRRQGTR